jgi:hypothetical protein
MKTGEGKVKLLFSMRQVKLLPDRVAPEGNLFLR